MQNWKLENPNISYEDKDKVIIEDHLEEVTEVTDVGVKEVDSNIDYELEEKEEVKKVVEKVVEKAVEEVASDMTENFKTLLYLNDKGILNLDEDAEYEDSEEGLKQAIQDHLTKEKETFEASIGEEEKELLEFIRNGGSVKDFIESKDVIDYEDLDLTDERTQFNLLIEHFESMGYSEEEALDSAKLASETGTLEKQALIAQKKLISLSKKTSEQQLETLKKAKEARELELVKQQEDYKKTILSTRSLKGFELKEAEAKQLYEFITKPVDKSGATALQKTNTEENKLAYAWLLMKGFNLDKLQKQAETKVVNKIKTSIGSHRDSLAKTKTTNIQQEEKESNDPKKLKISWNIGKKN